MPPPRPLRPVEPVQPVQPAVPVRPLQRAELEPDLVAFARLALEEAEAALPPHRSRFSKRLFTQPQLLAILCVLRHTKWSLRLAQ